MYSRFQKKTSHCQDQAINTLQNIFPSVNLPQFSKKSSVWEVLEKSAKNLPRPGLCDITMTISNMKTVVDSQQLKIQKNMIEIQKCQKIIMSEKKSLFESGIKSYEPSTGIKRSYRKVQQYEFQSMEQENEEYNYQKYEVQKKNQFFSEHDEIDYFQQSNHSQIQQNTFDDEDVKKYLSFDF